MKARFLTALVVVMSQGACAPHSYVPAQADFDLHSISTDPSCELFVWPLPVEVAVRILKDTQIFTDTAVYYGGLPTPQVAAFNVIMDQEEARDLFEDIARGGGPVGRLYALSAYQILDPARSSLLVEELSGDTETIYVQFGCTGMSDVVGHVANMLDNSPMGGRFREARDRTYAYFGEPANICMQATARRILRNE